MKNAVIVKGVNVVVSADEYLRMAKNASTPPTGGSKTKIINGRE